MWWIGYDWPTVGLDAALGIDKRREVMSARKQSHAEELERSYQDGEVIVEEGDGSRDMFVIQSGSVRITKRIAERVVELATLRRGDFFGEMSLLESLPRDASAHAIGETHLLVISAGALLVRMRRDPTFAFEMLQRLSGRVRKLNARVVQLIESAGDGSAEPATMMYAPASVDEGDR